jgi:NCS1 family nucleobase:cation symporter-1
MTHTTVRRAAFFTAGGGIYGEFNWVAIGVYLIGVLVELPFMIMTFYTGFIAKHLNGGDITWLVSLAVTTPLSYFALKSRGSQGVRQAAPIPQSIA